MLRLSLVIIFGIATQSGATIIFLDYTATTENAEILRKATLLPSGEMRGSASPKTSDGGLVTRRFSPVSTETAVNSYGPVVEGLSGTRIHLPSGVQVMENEDG